MSSSISPGGDSSNVSRARALMSSLRDIAQEMSLLVDENVRSTVDQEQPPSPPFLASPPSTGKKKTVTFPQQQPHYEQQPAKRKQSVLEEIEQHDKERAETSVDLPLSLQQRRLRIGSAQAEMFSEMYLSNKVAIDDTLEMETGDVIARSGSILLHNEDTMEAMRRRSTKRTAADEDFIVRTEVMQRELLIRRDLEKQFEGRMQAVEAAAREQGWIKGKEEARLEVAGTIRTQKEQINFLEREFKLKDEEARLNANKVLKLMDRLSVVRDSAETSKQLLKRYEGVNTQRLIEDLEFYKKEREWLYNVAFLHQVATDGALPTALSPPKREESSAQASPRSPVKQQSNNEESSSYSHLYKLYEGVRAKLHGAQKKSISAMLYAERLANQIMSLEEEVQEYRNYVSSPIRREMAKRVSPTHTPATPALDPTAGHQRKMISMLTEQVNSLEEELSSVKGKLETATQQAKAAQSSSMIAEAVKKALERPVTQVKTTLLLAQSEASQKRNRKVDSVVALAPGLVEKQLASLITTVELLANSISDPSSSMYLSDDVKRIVEQMNLNAKAVLEQADTIIVAHGSSPVNLDGGLSNGEQKQAGSNNSSNGEVNGKQPTANSKFTMGKEGKVESRKGQRNDEDVTADLERQVTELTSAVSDLFTRNKALTAALEEASRAKEEQKEKGEEVAVTLGVGTPRKSKKNIIAARGASSPRKRMAEAECQTDTTPQDTSNSATAQCPLCLGLAAYDKFILLQKGEVSDLPVVGEVKDRFGRRCLVVPSSAVIAKCVGKNPESKLQAPKSFNSEAKSDVATARLVGEVVASIADANERALTAHQATVRMCNRLRRTLNLADVVLSTARAEAAKAAKELAKKRSERVERLPLGMIPEGFGSVVADAFSQLDKLSITASEDTALLQLHNDFLAQAAGKVKAQLHEALNEDFDTPPSPSSSLLDGKKKSRKFSKVGQKKAADGTFLNPFSSPLPPMLREEMVRPKTLAEQMEEMLQASFNRDPQETFPRQDAFEVVSGPQGRVCLVFTDIQSSTLLWARYPTQMRAALEIHNALLRDNIAQHDGYEVKTIGDAFMVAFASPSNALKFSLAIQTALLRTEFDPVFSESIEETMTNVAESAGNKTAGSIWKGLRVRVSIHLGEPLCETDSLTNRTDYFGPMVNLAARINGVAFGGQVLISDDLFLNLLEGAHRSKAADVFDTTFGAVVQSTGFHTMKGIEKQVELFSVLPKALRWREKDFEEQTKIQERKKQKKEAPRERGSIFVGGDDENGGGEEEESWDGVVAIVAVLVQRPTELVTRLWRRATKIFYDSFTALAADAQGYVSKDNKINMFQVVFRDSIVALRFALELQSVSINLSWDTEICLATEVYGARQELLYRGLSPKIGIHSCTTSSTYDTFLRRALFNKGEAPISAGLALNARVGEVIISKDVAQAAEHSLSLLGDPVIVELPSAVVVPRFGSVGAAVLVPKHLEGRLQLRGELLLQVSSSDDEEDDSGLQQHSIALPSCSKCREVYPSECFKCSGKIECSRCHSWFSPHTLCDRCHATTPPSRSLKQEKTTPVLPPLKQRATRNAPNSDAKKQFQALRIETGAGAMNSFLQTTTPSQTPLTPPSAGLQTPSGLMPKFGSGATRGSPSRVVVATPPQRALMGESVGPPLEMEATCAPDGGVSAFLERDNAMNHHRHGNKDVDSSVSSMSTTTPSGKEFTSAHVRSKNEKEEYIRLAFRQDDANEQRRKAVEEAQLRTPRKAAVVVPQMPPPLLVSPTTSPRLAGSNTTTPRRTPTMPRE